MKKLLIVDDAPTIIKILDFTLSEAGYTVFSASNAEQAMEQIRINGPFSAGIFDVNMPGKNGIELTREVMRLPEKDRMNILILTTEFSEALKNQGREAGAKAWLVKPFEEEDLLEVVNALSGNLVHARA